MKQRDQYKWIRQEINRCVNVVCTHYNVSPLPSIGFDFNSALTVTMGRAYTFFRTNSGHLEFSPKVWAKATAQQRKENVVHEVAHVLTNLLTKRSNGHNHRWRHIMNLLGQPPNRTHVVPVQRRSKPKRPRYFPPCACTGASIADTTRTRWIRKGINAGKCNNCGKAFLVKDMKLQEKARG